MQSGYPEKIGLYDPRFEHDSCGVGFVCKIDGQRNRDTVIRALEVLERMSHRGAVGADPETGDGAGILIQVPDTFFRKEAKSSGVCLPDAGQYGTGLVFLPREKYLRIRIEAKAKEIVEKHGQKIIWWREVPCDTSVIGKTARKSCPVIKQLFISCCLGKTEYDSFERKLYVIRKSMEKAVSKEKSLNGAYFYVTNLSSMTLSYKGLLTPHQVKLFYPDLMDADIKSALAIVHSRYSTNTFPAWDLAQPFRYLAHNGEINTLRGNINRMRARENLLKSDLFSSSELEDIKPVITPDASDSATIDNVFELLSLSGRSGPEAMAMLMPPAWEKDKLMSSQLKDFFRYNSCIMEPWDGPAAIAFTDGTRIGAVLDRNGLRPARYLVTKDGYVIMASEVGVQDIDPSDIKISGRLEPGKILFIDTQKKRIVGDDEIKKDLVKISDRSLWLKKNVMGIDDLPLTRTIGPDLEGEEYYRVLNAFGYTREDINSIIRPMFETGGEPTGAMGNDTPHAILSRRTQVVFSYFKQLFAQVTNPSIDPIREDLVMSLETFIGPRGNMLAQEPEDLPRISVPHPVLTDEELAKLLGLDNEKMRALKVSMLFDPNSSEGLEQVLDGLAHEVSRAVEAKNNIIVLSDRGINEKKAAIPSLLALGRVHQHLIETSQRDSVVLVVETGEAREVHHFALLFGYGADCVNPYIAYSVIRKNLKESTDPHGVSEALNKYVGALEKGLMKILSKMGISTLESYKGAQIFEALGIKKDVVDKCFTGTVSRIAGAGFKELAEETVTRHSSAYFPEDLTPAFALDSGGIYQWKRDGDFHLWRPESIAALQDAVRNNDWERYKEFSSLINDQSDAPTTLRSLLTLKKKESVRLEEVESTEDIAKRFATGAMSYGSISRGAHEALAIAMNRIGGKSNTGEGGEDPVRFVPYPNGDSARSAIKQVASGRFGVTANYLVNADEIQIKIAQGAKPGEGGQLPGHKVSATIARTRYTTPGVTLISPPPHHDIYSIEDLAQLIFDLKNVNPNARISVKLVSEAGVGTIAAGVAKGHADMILISGGDGGTGASPKSSIRHAGLPWELGLSETHQTLVLNDLRSRVCLQTDGQMRTGRDVAIAAILGAEEFGFCTSALICLGCVMLRHCNLNNCSVGIATQDQLLEKRFRGRAEHVVNYFLFVIRELREIMASLGVRSMNELIGRTDLVDVDEGFLPEKARKIDLTEILQRPDSRPNKQTFCSEVQDHGIDNVLDRKLISLFSRSLSESLSQEEEMKISNVDRAVGAMLSGHICSLRGEEGLPEDSFKVKFTGVAGQSFGAFLSRGVSFTLEGLANDYVGKGLSGGKIIIRPGKGADYDPAQNVIMGNTTFYGATAGEAYINGIAGERFCIRNSGVYAVVEGVGDHGCEYMTGGRVVIIGDTGRNFAAGMSGGIAYLYDPFERLPGRYNNAMVELEELEENDVILIRQLLSNHRHYTSSQKAGEILDDFEGSITSFVKVMPMEYKRILSARKVAAELDLTEVSDG